MRVVRRLQEPHINCCNLLAFIPSCSGCKSCRNYIHGRLGRNRGLVSSMQPANRSLDVFARVAKRKIMKCIKMYKTHVRAREVHVRLTTSHQYLSMQQGNGSFDVVARTTKRTAMKCMKMYKTNALTGHQENHALAGTLKFHSRPENNVELYQHLRFSGRCEK